MSEEWKFPTTQEIPEVKIAYGSKKVKTHEELKTSKYFSRGRKINPLYLRDEEFGGIAQKGAMVYILNKPAFDALKKYLQGKSVEEDSLKVLRSVGLI
jgi:hypothetical protein